MAELITPQDVNAELAATADYDVSGDLDKARRRAAALRRKLDFPESMGGREQNMAFAMQAIENQLQQALAWIAANSDPTDAQKQRNPAVTHADFSVLRGYSC